MNEHGKGMSEIQTLIKLPYPIPSQLTLSGRSKLSHFSICIVLGIGAGGLNETWSMEEGRGCGWLP